MKNRVYIKINDVNHSNFPREFNLERSISPIYASYLKPKFLQLLRNSIFACFDANTGYWKAHEKVDRYLVAFIIAVAARTASPE